MRRCDISKGLNAMSLARGVGGTTVVKSILLAALLKGGSTATYAQALLLRDLLLGSEKL